MDSPPPTDAAYARTDIAQDFHAFLAVFDAAWGLAPRLSPSPSPGLQPTPLSPAPSSPEPLVPEPSPQFSAHRATVAAVSHTSTSAVSATATSLGSLSSSPPRTCIASASTTTTTTTIASMPVSTRPGRAHGHSLIDVELSEERDLTMPLPMTPPPPHGPISAATLKALGGGGVPPLLGHPTPAVPTPTPVPVGGKATASGTNRSDFASVFFSPIPLSYLSIARSESHDSVLAQSVGSPTDATLRGGRLSTAALNSDWAEEAEAMSAASALSALQRARSGGSSNHLGENGADTGAFPTPLLQSVSSTDTPRKSRLAALTAAADEAAGAAGLGASPNSHHSGISLRSHAVGSHSSTSPDSVLSSEAQLPSSSAPRHVASSPSRSSPIACTPPSSALHPLLSRASAAASILSSSPPQGIPRGPAGPLATLPDDLLPPMAHSDLMHGAGISIAAAASSKVKGSMLRLVAGTAMIPHIDKVDKGGEDAFCVSHHGLGAVGVADGVSGWAEEGIDPAAYSRSLMRYTSEALQSSNQPNGADPREVIRYAHMATVMAGSSTICVAVMKPCGKLQVANLGDSGVRLIRDGKIVFASTAQQHMFNMPFQLSHPSIIESPDDADSADVNTLDVIPGDVVVLATDGLYDNVFDDEICQVCTDTLRSLAVGNPGGLGYSAMEAEIVAGAVARTAHAYAQNPHQRTPWSVAASETGLPWARFFTKGGGKMDDVTVVVGFVVPDNGR